MTINELVDVWDDLDIEKRDGDNELKLIDNSENSAMWIKLKKFYNWDNPYDEILYFYFRDTKNNILKAVSFGWADSAQDDAYMIRLKEFDINPNNIISYINPYDDDPWEIGEEDLDISDRDSLSNIIINIFNANSVDIEHRALTFINEVFDKLG